MLAGLSVAFDASCEEMWLAWRHGACLVAAPRSLVRTGMDLGPWLVAHGITAVSTVPTLAALWPAETLDDVRLLIFGGEACPPELAARLAVEGREVWNTYGPTEATVVASAALMTGEGPVRIGLPLDGWDLAVVDAQGEPVEMGGTGELIIGGVGLARYLDPAKDAEKYAPCPASAGSAPTAAVTWSAPSPKDSSSPVAPTSRSSSAGGGSSWARSTRRSARCPAWRERRPPSGVSCWSATS
ncbi:AMP-binding protein [Nonomuraea recticatena]|uniref:AMP-binding protein n=1 Tax=Nonomuraea recticatena TaxID=46178 RepID=UPI003609D383